MLSKSFSALVVLAIAIWPFGQGRKNAEIGKTELELPRDVRAFQTVRVMVMNGVPEVVIGTNTPYKVFDGKGRSLFQGDRIVATPVGVVPEGIRIGNQSFRDYPITISSPGGEIKLGDYWYRESLTFLPEPNGKLSVVNEVGLEDYLKGVLPWEINPKWPAEALKAQAIASRTYALFRAIERKDESFDLFGDIKSQVYKGKGIENEFTNATIEATRGQILTYRGKIFPAFFHSTCGGSLTRAEHVWNVDPHPIFRTAVCRFCRGTKHYSWQERFHRDEIKTVLCNRGYNLSGINQIAIDSTDQSGRARFFAITDGKSEFKVHSNEFRMWLDPGRFKSTRIDSIKKTEDSFLFRGRGWGHGVGMCQYGMKELAELGYSHRQILDYYYPGANVINVKK